MNPRSSRPLTTLLLLLAAGTGWCEENLSDPMRPPEASSDATLAEAAPKYVLHGTILGSDRRVALVNGLVLELGNRIGDAEVVGIEVGRVVLAEGDTEFELTTTTERGRPDTAVVVDQRVAHEDP